MTTFRLGSNSFVSAPGIVRWAINGAHFKKDRKALCNVIASTWNIPSDAAMALITKRTPFTVEGETVIFSFAS